jgi:hypothetical protein
LIFLVALLMATYLPTAQVELGALALAFGFQLWPSLAAICWLPWITRQGATLGLAAGLVAVVLTEQLGTTVTEFFGFPLPWGRWPWTIHSAGWGIFFNVAVCIIVSLLTRNKGDRQHRMKYHGFLAETAALPAEKQFLRPVAWTITLAWLFFAVGPGAVIGNDFFGPPNKGIAVWNLGVPSIWAWQILLWVLGVLVIWLLAYKLEMSTVPRGTISAQNADRGTPEIEPEARTKSWLGQSREQGTAMQTS